MGFGQIDTWSIPQLDNHAQALAHYHKVVPIKGSDDIRPIGCRRKQHMRIILQHNGDVACRLHQTDVVTYHPDNSITLCSWSSMSTNDFAYAILPRGIYPRFTLPATSVEYRDVGLRECIYVRADKPLTFTPLEGCWKLLTETAPYQRYSINRKRMNAARKESGLADFEAWLAAYVSMNGVQYGNQRYFMGHSAEMLGALKQGAAGWQSLVDKCGTTDAPAIMRKEVCKCYGCVDVTTEPYLLPSAVPSVMASIRRLQHLAL